MTKNKWIYMIESEIFSDDNAKNGKTKTQIFKNRSTLIKHTLRQQLTYKKRLSNKLAKFSNEDVIAWKNFVDEIDLAFKSLKKIDQEFINKYIMKNDNSELYMSISTYYYRWKNIIDALIDAIDWKFISDNINK